MSSPLKPRLGLESLENRDVPTALTWTNAMGDGNFYTVGNWDYTGTQVVASVAPMVGDDVTFDSGWSNANCTNLGVLQIGGGGGGGTGMTTSGTAVTVNPPGLNSLNLIDGYAGTVSVVAPLQVGTLTLDAAPTGAISQAFASGGNDITVTSAFNWTSGTLNSSANSATVHLAGATATINPGAGNTITTGDTLSLEARNGIGTVATFLPGTLTFNNDSELTIDDLCSADVNPQQNATITFSAGLTTFGNQAVTIKAGGTLTVTGPGTWNGEGVPLKNNGGTFEIKNTAVASFSALPNTGMYTVTQTAGITKLHSGATLTANSFGLYLQGGEFRIIGDSPNGQTAPATLNGNMLFSGGSLTFTGNYWTFNVTGDVKWTGGSFFPRLDVSQNGATDIWLISGKLTIPNDSTAQIVPMTYNWNPTTGIPGDWRWESLIFNTVQLPDNGALPSIVTIPGNAPMKIFPSQINGKTVWLLGPQPN